MAPDPLQQLRDIHVPEPPGWWPPAPGWWLLAMLALVALAWLILKARAARRRRLPIRRARRLYGDLYGRYRRGEISARAYLHHSNELLKRVLIHGVGDDRARRASGRAWLELLDRHLREPAFTQGPGQLLGDARFRPRLRGDVDALHPLIERLLARLAPVPERGTR